MDQVSVERLAIALAGGLRSGDAVLLSGPLGAANQPLRGVLRAACGDPAMDVPSPSYTLVQSYDAPGLTLHHFDLWRLDGPAGVAELGWDDARAGVVLVEWPDRLGHLRPAAALEITLEIDGELRRVTVRDRRRDLPR